MRSYMSQCSRAEQRRAATVLALFVSLFLWLVPGNELAFAGEPSASNQTIQSLLDQAEPIYLAERYKEVVRLYEQAVQQVDNAASQASLADRIKCLRYLADCYCRLNQPDKALEVYHKLSTIIPQDDV